ncbi:17225_t:CDS:2, partial [Funneliformis geosporum]
MSTCSIDVERQNLKVINSVPAIQISVEDTTELPFPDMGFYAKFPFNIECQFHDGIDEMNEIIDNSCNNSLTHPQLLRDDPYPGYFGYFVNNKNLKFTKITKIGNQFIEIKLFANSYNDFIEFYLVDS